MEGQTETHGKTTSESGQFSTSTSHKWQQKTSTGSVRLSQPQMPQ